jgi:hypothetical protein
MLLTWLPNDLQRNRLVQLLRTVVTDKDSKRKRDVIKKVIGEGLCFALRAQFQRV